MTGLGSDAGEEEHLPWFELRENSMHEYIPALKSAAIMGEQSSFTQVREGEVGKHARQ